MRDAIRRALAGSILAALSAASLSGCGSTETIERPSTYVGDISEAFLRDLYLESGDGKRVAIADAFPGYRPQTGFLTTPLPFRRVAVADIVYEAAKPVARYYDENANDNGYLEGPELLVLYIREGAIGLGVDVDYVGINPRVDALATSAADTGGLVDYVNGNRDRMTESAQAIFVDIDRIGLDRRQRGGGGAGGGAGGGGGN